MSYLTLRQWERGEQRRGRRGERSSRSGREWLSTRATAGAASHPRSSSAAGVLWHLLAPRTRLRRGPHRLVSLLLPAGRRAAAPRAARYRIVVDWHEVWSRDYWVEYLGRAGRPCRQRRAERSARGSRSVPSASRGSTPRRLRDGGLRGEVTVLEGEYAGALEASEPAVAPSRSWCSRDATFPRSGCRRSSPRSPLVRRTDGDVRCVDLRRRPGTRASCQDRIDELGLGDSITAPGFVDADEVEDALRRAGCMVLPSRREGYGMIVIEAAAAGTPERGRPRRGQRRHRADRGRRERLRGAVGVAGGPRRRDSARARRADSSCVARRRTGSPRTRGGSRSSRRSSEFERLRLADGSCSVLRSTHVSLWNSESNGSGGRAGRRSTSR